MNKEALNRLFGITPEGTAAAPPAERRAESFPAVDTVVELSAAALLDFPDQPFKPYTENRLAALEASIRENGIINPIIVRRLESGYQIVCGHNRRRAALRAGYEYLPCVVRELDEDEARILLVESNLMTRTELLPSEKAFAYKMKLEAIKHQGARTDLTSAQVGPKLPGKESREILAEQNGDSRNQISRFVRLTALLTPLLDLVDAGKLPFTAGVELSFLSEGSQRAVYTHYFVDNSIGIDGATAQKLRELGKDRDLTADDLRALTAPEAPPRPLRKVRIPMKPLKRYFPATATEKEVQEIIIKAVIEYFSHKTS